MTTTNTRYVDPNAAAGGDGTTNALSGANCAYVSLAVWEAARQADLTASDVIERAVCSSDDAGSTHLADTTACTIDGWTTDATRYIQIEAASSHGGKWNDTIYRRNATLICKGDYTKIVGLQVSIALGSYQVTYGVSMECTGGLCKSAIARMTTAGNGSAGTGLRLYGSGCTATFQNCLAYDWTAPSGGAGISIVANGGSAAIQNCTIVGSTTGIARSLALVTATNAGISGCATAISGTVTQITCSTDTPTFVDADNDDFHLAAGDTTWRGNGTDLSAIFTDDIDGDTRSAWDIGCDEYVAAAPAGLLPFMFQPQYHPAFGGLTYG